MTSTHLSLFSQLTSSHWAGWVSAAIGAVAAGLYVVWLRLGAALKARQKSILATAEAGPFDPPLAQTGQAVILASRPGTQGIVAAAWRQRRAPTTAHQKTRCVPAMKARPS